MEKTFPAIDGFLKTGQVPSPVDFQYYHLLNKNVILINDAIADSLVEYGIMPLIELDSDPDVEHITIYLNTNGGDVYTGFAFVHVLEHIQTPTTLRIIGMAASMGSLIAMAKSPFLTVICDKWSVGLIHKGSLVADEDAEIDEAEQHFNDEYDLKVREYILSHTNMTSDYYDHIQDMEFWMDAQTMKKLNIVNEIIDD